MWIKRSDARKFYEVLSQFRGIRELLRRRVSQPLSGFAEIAQLLSAFHL